MERISRFFMSRARTRNYRTVDNHPHPIRTKGRPNNVRIGPHNYTIRWTNGREMHEFGHHDNNVLFIDIREDVAPSQAKLTLLHEVMHCICGLVYASDEELDVSEEVWISRCSPNLYAVLNDNPLLRKYLFGVV
jgi:hypothetical protein